MATPRRRVTPIESLLRIKIPAGRQAKTARQQDIDERISAGLMLWYFQNPELDKHPLSIKATAELIACLRAAFEAPKRSL